MTSNFYFKKISSTKKNANTFNKKYILDNIQNEFQL